MAPLAKMLLVITLAFISVNVKGEAHMVGKTAEKAAAVTAVEEYFASFNARDTERFARSLHYPHMRIDGLGKTNIWQHWEDYARQIDFAVIAKRDNWHHTQLDAAEVIQAGTNKAHILVRYTRYDPDNRPLLSEESMYVVTYVNQRWAIQMRSSFLEQSMGHRQ